jgi:pilus assembly protein FimV
MMDAGLNTDFNETAKFSLDDLPRDLPSEAVAAVPAPQDDLDLSDFNLEASALPEMDMDFGIAPEVAAPAPAAPEAEDMKFDLDDMDFGIAEPDPDATIVARSPAAAPEALSLPDLDLPPVASENDEFADMLADLPDLDDSFMVPDVPSAPVGESAMAPAEAHAAPMANDFDMSSIDLDLNSASDAADSGQSSIDNLDGLGDLDDLNELNEGDEMSSVQVEMDTKLDLAVAYQEIGDKEGARELIDEVIKGGSPDQVEKAKAMRAKLA